jgi:hypothetical protein
MNGRREIAMLWIFIVLDIQKRIFYIRTLAERSDVILQSSVQPLETCSELQALITD